MGNTLKIAKACPCLYLFIYLFKWKQSHKELVANSQAVVGQGKGWGLRILCFY